MVIRLVHMPPNYIFLMAQHTESRNGGGFLLLPMQNIFASCLRSVINLARANSLLPRSDEGCV